MTDIIFGTATVKGAIATIRSMGLTCARTPFGEFRVNFPNGSDETAYYTCDAVDAIDTARIMSRTLRES